jgi:hypothetical protein
VVSRPPVPPGPPDETDPTGVRALLSGLPDPGPMPADLVDRINASIAAEQSARAGTAGTAGSTTDGTVVPLSSRRRSWQRAGLVAAAAAVVAVGVPIVMSGTGHDVVTAFNGSGADSGAASQGAAGSSAQSLTPPITSFTGPAPSAGDRVGSPEGAVSMRGTGTAYRTAGLATQAVDQGDQAAAHAGQDRALGPADSAGGLRSCLTALGVAAWAPVVADRATLDGRPAVIAVVHGDHGVTVYAVEPGCDGTHPLRLAGPVPVH